MLSHRSTHRSCPQRRVSLERHESSPARESRSRVPPRWRGGPASASKAERRPGSGGVPIDLISFFCGSCMQLRPRSLPGNAKQCPRTVGASSCGRSLHWRESSSPSAEAHRLKGLISLVEPEFALVHDVGFASARLQALAVRPPRRSTLGGRR